LLIFEDTGNERTWVVIEVSLNQVMHKREGNDRLDPNSEQKIWL